MPFAQHASSHVFATAKALRTRAGHGGGAPATVSCYVPGLHVPITDFHCTSGSFREGCEVPGIITGLITVTTVTSPLRICFPDDIHFNSQDGLSSLDS